MSRIYGWLRGLFVPHPPPHKDLTPKPEFVRYEKDLARAAAELDTYRLRGRR